jgi:hypothetical protein
MKVGIYSPLTPLPSLVGNGYIIYLTTDSDATKWNCNCSRNSHGNSWIFAIAVLLSQTILEGTLLGSFHWRSNEEIPTLTFLAECVYIDSTRTAEHKLSVHIYFLESRNESSLNLRDEHGSRF